jgi:streptogramin lyase
VRLSSAGFIPRSEVRVSSRPGSSIKLPAPRRALGGLAAQATVAAVLCVLATTAPAEGSYEWVREWPVPDEASGIAVGSGGVYITQGATAFEEPAVQRYSPAGRLLGQWGDPGTEPGQLTDPSEVDVDPSGRVWVVDGFGEIIVYTAEGARVDRRLLTGPCGSEILLHDIEVDPIGEVYFPFYDNCDLPNDTREGVIRSTSSWQVLEVWGDSGPNDGQFNSPTAVASDGRGKVYVADATNYRIQQFTPAGAFVRKWGQLGGDPGEFNGLASVAIGPGGDVFAVDRSNQRIQRFAPNGKFIEQFAIPAGVEYEGLPSELEFDAKGNLYLLGTEGAETVDEVHVFAPAGGAGGSRLAIPRQKLRYRDGKIKVKLVCRASRTCRGTLRVTKGKTTIARRSYRVRAGQRATITVKPTPRGRATLRRSRTHRLTVRLRKSNGKTTSRNLTLRR